MKKDNIIIFRISRTFFPGWSSNKVGSRKAGRILYMNISYWMGMGTMCRVENVNKAAFLNHLWEKYQVVCWFWRIRYLKESGKRGNHNVEDLTCE